MRVRFEDFPAGPRAADKRVHADTEAVAGNSHGYAYVVATASGCERVAANPPADRREFANNDVDAHGPPETEVGDGRLEPDSRRRYVRAGTSRRRDTRDGVARGAAGLP